MWHVFMYVCMMGPEFVRAMKERYVKNEVLPMMKGHAKYYGEW
jgi:hypothetical protein